MSHTSRLEIDPDQPLFYEVRIKGHLGDRWNDWFDQMIVTPRANGETTLIGPITDQAALHGVLTKIRDLGLQLLSVTEIESLEAATHERREGKLSEQPDNSPGATRPTNNIDRKEPT